MTFLKPLLDTDQSLDRFMDHRFEKEDIEHGLHVLQSIHANTSVLKQFFSQEVSLEIMALVTWHS